MKDDDGDYVTAYYSLFSFSGGPQGAAPQQKNSANGSSPSHCKYISFFIKAANFYSIFYRKK